MFISSYYVLSILNVKWIFVTMGWVYVNMGWVPFNMGWVPFVMGWVSLIRDEFCFLKNFKRKFYSKTLSIITIQQNTRIE